MILTEIEIKKLGECIGLLNSMVLCGEKHSGVSTAVVEEARAILRAQEVCDGT